MFPDPCRYQVVAHSRRSTRTHVTLLPAALCHGSRGNRRAGTVQIVSRLGDLDAHEIRAFAAAGAEPRPFRVSESRLGVYKEFRGAASCSRSYSPTTISMSDLAASLSRWNCSCPSGTMDRARRETPHPRHPIRTSGPRSRRVACRSSTRFAYRQARRSKRQDEHRLVAKVSRQPCSKRQFRASKRSWLDLNTTDRHAVLSPKFFRRQRVSRTIWVTIFSLSSRALS